MLLISGHPKTIVWLFMYMMHLTLWCLQKKNKTKPKTWCL